MANFFQNRDKNLCCGCGACEQICPEGAIHMERDEEGFLYPVIDKKKCTNCGMCERVCPIKNGGYVNKNAFEYPKVYAAYHKDERILTKSTSGGAFTAIAQSFCDNNYVIFGASFDEEMVVRHKFITDIKDISKFRGSKYVQSEVGNAFQAAGKFLEEGKKVLFSGTPCQIAGLKEFIGGGHKNLLTVDIVCYGVPSPVIFEKYKQHLINKYKEKIIDINFREKNKRGWVTPYVVIKFEDGRIIRDLNVDNPFIISFYKGYSVRPACCSCPFAKVPRVSDITLGDFWGIEEIDPKFYNKKGNSLVLVNTEKGEKAFSISSHYLFLKKEKIEEAKKFNPRLYRSKENNPERNRFRSDSQIMKFEDLQKKYLKPRSLAKKILSLILTKKTRNKIKKFLKPS